MMTNPNTYKTPHQTAKEQAEAKNADVLRVLAQRDELLAALVEINERIKDHPAYAELTMEQEIEEGGDTAEFSYLSRLAKAAIAKVEGGA